MITEALRGLLSRVLEALPSGASLSHDEFERRHRAILILIWAQAAGTLAFGLLRQINPPLVIGGSLLIAALGGVAAIKVLAPRFRSAIATLALIVTSSLVVQFSGGYIEAHFHFFVMLAVIILYQDWAPFLLAILFVVIDHGFVGLLLSQAVYNHPAAREHPFEWALIHAAFVLGEAAALLFGWKNIERSQNEKLAVIERNLELTDMAEELTRARDAAEEAVATKVTFMASTSHELRTPLAAIIGFTDLLLDGAEGELTSSQSEDVGQIRASGKVLLELINNVLDFSKMDTGRLTVDLAEHTLVPLVADVISTLGPMAEAKGIRLVVEVPPNLSTLICDANKVRQVLTNLLSNAIKFTADGEVKVCCRDQGTSMEVSVIDTGIGIEPDAMEHIFEAFTQAESGSTRRFGGVGLGLALCRKLIELQGGSIGVESVVGKGSRFWFHLPKGSGAAVADLARRALEEAVIPHQENARRE